MEFYLRINVDGKGKGSASGLRQLKTDSVLDDLTSDVEQAIGDLLDNLDIDVEDAEPEYNVDVEVFLTKRDIP